MPVPPPDRPQHEHPGAVAAAQQPAPVDLSQVEFMLGDEIAVTREQLHEAHINAARWKAAYIALARRRDAQVTQLTERITELTAGTPAAEGDAPALPVPESPLEELPPQ